MLPSQQVQPPAAPGPVSKPPHVVFLPASMGNANSGQQFPTSWLAAVPEPAAAIARRLPLRVREAIGFVIESLADPRGLPTLPQASSS